MRRGAVLLDTCAAIWFANGDPLRSEALIAIQEAAAVHALPVSPVTAREVGTPARLARSAPAFAREAPHPR